ncbi:MAG: hypothetical protein AAF975_05720 [Spirochaetota bacterium]
MRRMEAIPKDWRLSIAQARAEIAGLNGEIQGLYRLIGAPFEFVYSLLAMADDLQNLALTPFEMAAQVMNMNADLGEAVLSVPGKMLANMSRAIVGLQNPFARLENLANGKTLQQYEMQLQMSGQQLVSLLYPASQAPYASREQAQNTQAELNRLLDTLKCKVDYTLYEQLTEIQADFQKAMAELRKTLPPEKKLENLSEPLLVALHRVKGKDKGKCIALLPNPFFPQDGLKKSEVLYV